MAERRHLLIVGASGVIGAGALAHFARGSGWQVTALSRRRPHVAGCAFDHLAVDLADRNAARDTLASLAPVTHVIYAAVAESPDLVQGWSDDRLIATNGAMFANLLDPLAVTRSLRHLILLQGTKAYGAHRHPVRIPMREDQPRDDHPNFYWLHEDHAKSCAAEHGFGVTIFRPQVLLGTAPGAAMNPAAAIGAYAALCSERGLPFAYPGEAETLWEVVDTSLLAEAFDWAFETPQARSQTYNITNGDVLVLAHAWADLAKAFGLSSERRRPPTLQAFFAEPESQAVWARLAERHGLLIASLDDFLGSSHVYTDLLLSARVAERRIPLLLSTIKLRQAGFTAVRDSATTLLDQIRQMTQLRLLPPIGR